MVVTSFAEPPLRMDVHSAQLFRDFLWMHLILTLLRASGFGVASRGFGEEGIRVRVARFILTLLLARWCRTTCRPTDKGHDKNTLIVRKEHATQRRADLLGMLPHSLHCNRSRSCWQRRRPPHSRHSTLSFL
jgi:hypothetical protein